MSEQDHSWTTKAQDQATESAVLLRVLDLHPVLMSFDELAGDIAGREAGFAGRDAVERAVRELADSGLLQRRGELIAPTRAALHFSELAER